MHQTQKCNASFIYALFGILNLAMSLIISILIEYCNENYKFLERNLLKRRFRYINILENLLKILILSLHFYESL